MDQNRLKNIILSRNKWLSYAQTAYLKIFIFIFLFFLFNQYNFSFPQFMETLQSTYKHGDIL